MDKIGNHKHNGVRPLLLTEEEAFNASRVLSYSIHKRYILFTVYLIYTYFYKLMTIVPKQIHTMPKTLFLVIFSFKIVVDKTNVHIYVIDPIGKAIEYSI